MTRPTLRFALLFAVACFLTGTAQATEKRTPPNYDGRGGRPTSTGDVLLWGPRVLMAPPYFVSEYLLRRPLGFAIAGAERAGLPAAVYDFFAFGPDHKAGIFPTAFLAFDFRPSVGLYSFWDDAFLEGHDLRLRGSIGGTDWLSGAFAERFHLGQDSYDRIAIEASGLKRPDFTFFGLGPRSRQSDLTRYGKGTLELRTRWDERLWRSSAFHAEVALRSVDFERGGFGTDRTLEDAIAQGRVDSPSGYGRGYTVLKSTLSVAYDSRLPRPASGTGIRLEANGAHSSELRTHSSFLSYGAEAGGFLDLNDSGRVLSVSVAADLADPVSGGEVPFTELPTLGGGDRRLHGLYPDRLAGRSTAAAELAYHWPIWIWLDGSIRAEVGNAFDNHLSGFDAGLLRWSGAIGVESSGERDAALQMLVGVGSETFESGGKVDSLRLVFGTTHGF